MDELIELLRALARYEHSDVSVAEEAADALEAAREEQDELAKDAAKYRWGINNARWIRGEQEAYVAIPVAREADLSCIALMDDAINEAMEKKNKVNG